MDFDDHLLRVVLTHMGFIKAYEERSKPLIDSLISQQISNDMLERVTVIIEMFRLEKYYVAEFLRATLYDDQNDRTKHYLIRFLLTMKSSLEDKINYFKDIIRKLKIQAASQQKPEWANNLSELEKRIPEIED